MTGWSPPKAFLVMGFMAPHLFPGPYATQIGLVVVAVLWGARPVLSLLASWNSPMPATLPPDAK